MPSSGWVPGSPSFNGSKVERAGSPTAQQRRFVVPPPGEGARLPPGKPKMQDGNVPGSPPGERRFQLLPHKPVDCGMSTCRRVPHPPRTSPPGVNIRGRRHQMSEPGHEYIPRDQSERPQQIGTTLRGQTPTDHEFGRSIAVWCQGVSGFTAHGPRRIRGRPIESCIFALNSGLPSTSRQRLFLYRSRASSFGASVWPTPGVK